MTTPTSQTTRIDPDILDATGALRCAEGVLTSVAAARAQVERLAGNAARGLRGDVPAVQEIRTYQAAIGAVETLIKNLVIEHVSHAMTQARFAADPNLRYAAIGYLDALRRA